MALALHAGRTAVVGALLAVITLSWVYVAAMAAHGMGAAMAPMAWTPSYAVSVFVMWVLMMVAMMLPSALPMILLVERLNRSRAARSAGLATGLFAAGYLVIWVGFGALATVTHWGLERGGLLSEGMALVGTGIAAGAFIAAGAYQFAPLKRTCLDACRAPLAFLSVHWRPGLRGAFLGGLRHGAFCAGCCGLLMALLFVGGVMNLLWIVPIALFVLIEKCLPGGERFGKAGGVLLVLWGALLLFMTL